MLFVNVTPLEPLPGFKAAFNISSLCFVKDIHLQCMFEVRKCEILRYLRFIGECAKMKCVVYDENTCCASFLGSEEEIKSFINEFLSDFEMGENQVFYLVAKQWHSLSIAKHKLEFPHAHVFMITCCY